MGFAPGSPGSSIGAAPPASRDKGAATYGCRSQIVVAFEQSDHKPTFLAPGASAATEFAGRFLVTNLSIGYN